MIFWSGQQDLQKQAECLFLSSLALTTKQKTALKGGFLFHIDIVGFEPRKRVRR